MICWWTSSRRCTLPGFVGGRLFVRVVRGADKWTRLDVADTEFEPDPFQLGELGRRVIPRHRQVGQRRTQVLTDGDDLAAGAREVPQCLDDFVPLFPEADHQS